MQEFAQAEQERVERQNEEGARVLKEVAALAEGRGHDASALRYFDQQ